MKLAQVRNVPEIRFKIFGGYWSFKRLGYFASQVKNKNYDQAESYALTNSATYGIVGQEEYFDREIAKNENLAKYYVVHIGDFIYNPRKSATASAGPIKRNRCAKGVISPIYTVFRFSTGNLDFFEHYFNSTKWHRHMKRIANYGARFDRLNITRTDFFNLPMPCISEEEQQKIASFLSSVDTKIEQLGKKKALLEQYKKGMMQKLFSQEISFKDEQGNHFTEWKSVALSDTKSPEKHSFTGGPFGSNLKREDYTKEGIRVIQLQNIGDGIFIDDHKIYTSIAKADQLKSCNIFPGEIIISKMGDPVARACLIPTNKDERYLMASDGIRLSVDSKKYDCKFVLDSINQSSFRRKAISHSTGSTRKRITLPDLRNLRIFVPQFKEQQKIADFLSVIDKKIELVAQQLEQARTFKKGLLQRMFI